MYFLFSIPALALLVIAAIWLRTLVTHRNPKPMLQQIDEARTTADIQRKWHPFYDNLAKTASERE